jgi:hypothetical protein
MRRLTFTVVVLVMLAATVALTLAVSQALGYEPGNRYDAPTLAACSEEHAMLTAAVEGCVRSEGRWVQGTEDGVLVARCVPSLGVYPVKR